MKVVLIDNDLRFLSSLKLWFGDKDLDIKFQSFSNPTEGIEYVLHNQKDIDVLITDYDLGDIGGASGIENGLELCSKLNKMIKILISNKTFDCLTIDMALQDKSIDHFVQKYDNGILGMLFDHIICAYNKELIVETAQ